MTNNGGVTRDPSRVAKLVPQTPQPPRHLPDEEEAGLTAAVNVGGGKLRDRAPLVLMLHSGLRVGEVCQLKWEDIRGTQSYLQQAVESIALE